MEDAKRFIYKSKAKHYKNYAINLVEEVCYRHIFNGNGSRSDVRKARGEIDYERDPMRRIYFSCEGCNYVIRLWDTTLKNTKGNFTIPKTEYSIYHLYNCNDCDEVFEREFPDGWTRCEECAKYYTLEYNESEVA